jgi:hypothetical protein
MFVGTIYASHVQDWDLKQSAVDIYKQKETSHIQWRPADQASHASRDLKHLAVDTYKQKGTPHTQWRPADQASYATDQPTYILFASLSFSCCAISSSVKSISCALHSSE